MLTPNRTIRTLVFVVLAAVAIAAEAPRLSADDFVVPRRPIDRRFPQGQFCPLPIEIEFIAPGPTVRVVFEAYRFLFDPSDGQLHWTEQYLDNVALADAATHDGNFAPPPAGSSSEFCYLGSTDTPFYYFNAAGPEALLEIFDTDPTARGWDMTQGAYFRSGYSGPRHPESASTPDGAGGSLGMGLGTGTPSATDVATTEITINGLTTGQTYNLSAWWDVNYVVFGSTDPLLAISVLAPGGTPVVKKSWSSLKRSYR